MSSGDGDSHPSACRAATTEQLASLRPVLQVVGDRVNYSWRQGSVWWWHLRIWCCTRLIHQEDRPQTKPPQW